LIPREHYTGTVSATPEQGPETRVSFLDEPGMFGDVALVMSKTGINIDSVYVTTRGHIVLGVDDLAGAIQIAGGMAVMTSE